MVVLIVSPERVIKLLEAGRLAAGRILFCLRGQLPRPQAALET